MRRRRALKLALCHGDGIGGAMRGGLSLTGDLFESADVVRKALAKAVLRSVHAPPAIGEERPRAD
jgi:hypothetical protein